MRVLIIFLVLTIEYLNHTHANSQLLMTIGAEGSGHHGFCDSGYLLQMAGPGESASMMDQTLTKLLSGHQFDLSKPSNALRGEWISDAGQKSASPTRGGQEVVEKVNRADLKQYIHSSFRREPGTLWLECGTAHPGAHEFGGPKPKSNVFKRHGINWYLDNQEVEHSLANRDLGAAIEALATTLDKLYPVDPRSILDATLMLPGKVKFLFTLRSLPGLLNSHPGFDGGACRHGLVLGATLSYFGKMSNDLPRETWRTVWYESMHNQHTKAQFEQELGAWLLVPKLQNASQHDDWQSSLKSLDFNNKRVPLKWARLIEQYLAETGQLGLLLDSSQVLGSGREVHLEETGNTSTFKRNESSKLWVEELGCSAPRDWYK
jgi:hypothetical protein